jgi:hypothetical protein
MLGLFKDRELRSQWQRAAELLLAEVATLALSARRLNWLCSTMPCRGVLDGGNASITFLANSIAARLRGPDRESPKTGGLHSRDRLVVQAPNISKPSSGPLFESLNQVPLVFHGTRSHAHGALDALTLFQRTNLARRGSMTN